MTMFSFQTVPQIIMQTGAAAALGPLLAKRFKPGRVCVITDAFLHRSGLLNPALASLNNAGFAVQVVDDVQADPPDHVVEAVAARGLAPLGGRLPPQDLAHAWRLLRWLPLTQWVYGLATLRAALARRVEWRGVHYRVRGRGVEWLEG